MTEDIDYKSLFEGVPVPQFVIGFVEGGKYCVLTANKSAIQFFKNVEGDVTGALLQDLFDKDDWNYIQQSLDAVLNSKESRKVRSVYEMEDGFLLSGFWVIPLFDAEDKIHAFNVIGAPASTQSINLQQERDDAISLLTSVFDVSEVGIIVTDQNHRIIRINDSFVRIYGWERDQLIGHKFTELTTPDEREKVQKNHEEFLRSGIRSSGEIKLLRSNGGIANALFTTAALELSLGRKFQITTIMDITLRKQMEISLRLAKEQADSANHAKSTFLANMSHELRTPLNAILGFSEMMIKETFGELGSPKYKEYLGDIHLSAQHLLEIINEVLDMSKIEAGRVELDEELFDITHLIRSVERMMASRAFSSGSRIEEYTQDDLPPLYADPRLVRQILINLVGNSVKYAQQNGLITIKTHLTEDGSLQIIVEDDGVGIPKDKIRDALEPFGQVNIPAESRTVQGTGLGLPLAKAMTELHSGSLFLESDSGKGTKVTVTFPSYRVKHDQTPSGI